jgi:hypothetical protein
MNTHVKIDRTKWLNADNGCGPLWDKSRKAGCCLGHAISQIYHMPIEELDKLAYPAGVRVLPLDGLFMEEDCLIKNRRATTKFTSNAISINDDGRINRKEREEKLIELFAKSGLTLEFFN